MRNWKTDISQLPDSGIDQVKRLVTQGFDIRALVRNSLGSDVRVAMLGPDTSLPGGVSTLITSYRNVGFPQRVAVEQIPCTSGGVTAVKLGAGLLSFGRLVAGLAVRRWDVIHIHSSLNASFARDMALTLPARTAGVPFVLQVHGGPTDWLEPSNGGARARLARWTLESAGAVVAVSQAWGDTLQRLAPRAHVVVIPNGVEIPARSGGNPAGPVVATGRLGPPKGTFVLIEAVASIEGLKSVIAGDGEIGEARKLATRLDAGARISIPGWLEESERECLLDGASIYCLPSRSEGLPMGLLEAMAHGLPVVVSPVGGIVDLVSDGKNGLVVSPDDPDALAEALKLLTNSPKLMKTLGDEARATIVDRYTIEASIASLADVYDSLTAQG